ncbi:RmlD substrate binding domain protein [uncultured archaeon]|nr:RmlD substrate binding domain protein [uncultured archaeon]
MDKVIVLGDTGMLGHKMVQILSQKYMVPIIGKAQFNPLRGDSILPFLEYYQPRAVVNCIGAIKQRSYAENEFVTLNALLPHNLHIQCEKTGAHLIHFSSDCVFSGENGPYKETAESDAKDIYGKTKYLGEVGHTTALTLRTSIIGRELYSTNGLLEWFLNERDTVNGYVKSFFSGVTTNWLAHAVSHLISQPKILAGIYQVASDPTSKDALLRKIRTIYGKENAIIPNEYPRCNRVLDGTRFEKETGIVVPGWGDMLLHQFQEDKRLYAGR